MLEIGFRWTRSTVCVPTDREHNGRGIQAHFFKLTPEETPPPTVAKVPPGVEVGLKVYRGVRTRETRDAAYRMQIKLARHAYAPQVFGRFKVLSINEARTLEVVGWGLLTECIVIKRWGRDGVPMSENDAQCYLRARLPGFGDLHPGNFGWNARLHLPQVLDMGDHGINGLGWTRVPGASYHAARAVRGAAEREVERAAEERRKALVERVANRGAAHARRKARGLHDCRTCGERLRTQPTTPEPTTPPEPEVCAFCGGAECGCNRTGCREERGE